MRSLISFIETGLCWLSGVVGSLSLVWKETLSPFLSDPFSLSGFLFRGLKKELWPSPFLFKEDVRALSVSTLCLLRRGFVLSILGLVWDRVFLVAVLPRRAGFFITVV